jgi:hypothetical protein
VNLTTTRTRQSRTDSLAQGPTHRAGILVPSDADPGRRVDGFSSRRAWDLGRSNDPQRRSRAGPTSGPPISPITTLDRAVIASTATPRVRFRLSGYRHGRQVPDAARTGRARRNYPRVRRIRPAQRSRLSHMSTSGSKGRYLRPGGGTGPAGPSV